MCGVKGFAARRAAGIGCVNVLHLRNRQAKVAREIGEEGPLPRFMGVAVRKVIGLKPP